MSAISYPAVRLVILTRTRGIRDLVISIIAVDEVLHDGAALEQADRAAISEGIRQGRDTPVGVDIQEPLLL